MAATILRLGKLDVLLRLSRVHTSKRIENWKQQLNNEKAIFAYLLSSLAGLVTRRSDEALTVQLLHHRQTMELCHELRSISSHCIALHFV
jgi:hypothetical protein